MGRSYALLSRKPGSPGTGHATPGQTRSRSATVNANASTPGSACSSCASCSSASARRRCGGSPSGAVRLRSVITCRSAIPDTSRPSSPMYARVHCESRLVVTPLVRSTMLLPPPLL